MKIETFKYNLDKRLIPQAQSILIETGLHIPTLFTYDSDGVERITDLGNVFSIRNKDEIFKVLESYLNETKSLAFVLICEAWLKTIPKSEEYKEEHKALLEGKTSIRDIKDKSEVLTFQWSFKSSDVKSGCITYPFVKENGNIRIDYDNCTSTDQENNQFSRASNLLRV